MTQTPEPQSSRDRDRNFEEWVAVIVALLAFGSILGWTLLRGDRSPLGWFGESLDRLALQGDGEAAASGDRRGASLLPFGSNAGGTDRANADRENADRENAGDRAGAGSSEDGAATEAGGDRQGTPGLAGALGALGFAGGSGAGAGEGAGTGTSGTATQGTGAVTGASGAGTTSSGSASTGIGGTATSGTGADGNGAGGTATEGTEGGAATGGTNANAGTGDAGQADEPELTAPPVQASVEFSDVPPDYWAYPFIKALADRGIVAGQPDGSFDPDRPVTRAELAATVRNVFAQREAQRNAPNFVDLEADYWAQEAIVRVYQTGFMSGYPGGEFRPDREISRLESFITFASGLPLSEPATPAASLDGFQDGNAVADWAAPKIAAAADARLVVSHPDSQVLQLEAPTTRAEMAAFVYQSLVYAGELEPVDSPFIAQP